MIGVRVGLSISPLAKRRLNEAFRFSICLWRVGPGADVFEAEIAAGVAEVEGLVARAVVGHHAGNLDAEALVVADSGLKEGDGALLFLVGHDLDKGDAKRRRCRHARTPSRALRRGCA